MTPNTEKFAMSGRGQIKSQKATARTEERDGPSKNLVAGC
jgi:hypothetical protein